MSQRRSCMLNCPRVRGTILHSFPKDEIRRQVWLELINMEYTSKIHTYLCGRHFSPRMFFNRKLKRDAVPDINLEFVEHSSVGLEEDGNSQYECVDFNEYTNTSLEASHKISAIQNPLKVTTVSKTVKTVPFDNLGRDPLFVSQKELISNNTTKHCSAGVTETAIIDSTEAEMAAVQSLIRVDSKGGDGKSVRMVIKQRIKDGQENFKTRAPLAPLEMRLATKIWQTAELQSECSRKLPTLHTHANKQKMPAKNGVHLSVGKKNTSSVGSMNSRTEERRIISPPGPVRVKNIHELDSTWKEHVKKVAEVTENVKSLLAEAQEFGADELTNSYFMESNEIIIEEKPGVEDFNSFTPVDIEVEQSPYDDTLATKSEIIDRASISRDKNAINNLLCDEVMPKDEYDEDCEQSAKRMKHNMIDQNCNTESEFLKFRSINEEIFDVSLVGSSSRPSANIVMMGIEDFEKITDDHFDNAKTALISEASQTGNALKHGCGLIERYSYNGTFYMTCFYCAEEFPLWEWQKFVNHITTEHRSQMAAKSCSISREVTMSISKQQSRTSYPHFSSSELKRLLPHPNIKHVLVQGTEPNTMALMPLQKVVYGKRVAEHIISSAKKYRNNGENDKKDYDGESLSSENSDDIFTDKNVVTFKKSEPARIIQFLEILREHPLLWHSRRHGPTIYDLETEKFIQKFDKTMSPMNFRSSIDYMRLWYRRYTQPTPAKITILATIPHLKEYFKRLNEIEELSKDFALHCEQCEFYFLDEDRLATHRYLKHNIGELKFECSCGLRFPSANRREDHELTHKPKPSYMCELCGMIFQLHQSLLSHMNTKHAEKIKDPLPYKCNECDARFPNSHSRSWHALKHAPPRFNCKICNKSYFKYFPYKQHLKKHMNQRDYVCDECGKAFVEKRGLQNHRYRMHNVGGYHCEYCNTYYSTYEKLNKHNELTHPNGTNTEKRHKLRKKVVRERKKRSCCSLKPRVFRCKECGTVFERQYQLMRHKRLLGHYLGEQYLKCSHCSVVCKSRVALVRHLRSMHKMQISFGDIKEEDYFVPTFDGNTLEDLSEANEGDESEYAVQSIICSEEEEEEEDEEEETVDEETVDEETVDEETVDEETVEEETVEETVEEETLEEEVVEEEVVEEVVLEEEIVDEENIIVQDEEIQEIFEEFKGDVKDIEVVSNNHVD